MALGFFRRRQKMVIIIMVVLMLSFLLGGFGLSSLLRRNPNEQAVGQTRYGPLTLGELKSAKADIDVLDYIGLGDMRRFPPGRMPMESYTFARLKNPTLSFDSADVPLDYALLLKEAQATGVQATKNDVDYLFQLLGYRNENSYQLLISQLRSLSEGWTEQNIRAAVAGWMEIYKSFEGGMVQCPPSETEIRKYFRDVNEQINLRVLRLKASDYVSKVPEPDHDAILKQFQKDSGVAAGTATDPNSMGFGYYEPDKAEVHYLLVRGDVVGRVTQVPFDDLVQYYDAHKKEFVRQVPITPATKPGDANAPATKPADANTPMKTVQLTFPEAKQEIIAKKIGTTISSRIGDLTSYVGKTVNLLLKGGEDPNNVYMAAVKEMTQPATGMLAKPLKGLKIVNLPLDEAMDRLAEAASITEICFPWGTHGKETIDKSLKVTITGDMTLGKALDRICDQVKRPPLHWAGCATFPKMLFSVKVKGEGIDDFPLKAFNTPLWSDKQFAKDDVLGSCYTSPPSKNPDQMSQGTSFVNTVFTAPEFTNNPKKARIHVGEEGSPMYLHGEKTGQLMWRLIAVEPKHKPKMMSRATREQVIKDLRLKAAMQLAMKDALTVREAAYHGIMAAAVKSLGFETFDTGLFSRMRASLLPSLVPKLEELNTPPLLKYFKDKAFSLAPKDPKADVDKLPPAAEVVPVPLRAEVLVILRIGYEPAYQKDYDTFGRLKIERQLLNNRNVGIPGALPGVLDFWFSDKLLKRRLDYKQAPR